MDQGHQLKEAFRKRVTDINKMNEPWTTYHTGEVVCVSDTVRELGEQSKLNHWRHLVLHKIPCDKCEKECFWSTATPETDAYGKPSLVFKFGCDDHLS